MSAVYGVHFLFGKHVLITRIIRRNLLLTARAKFRLDKIIGSSLITSLTQQSSSTSLRRTYVTDHPTETEAERKYRLKEESYCKITPLYNWNKSEFDEDDEESRNRRKTTWRRTKFTLILLSSMLGLAGVYTFYILGSPKKDEFGNLVEDEFSTLPVPQQFFKRMLRELDYLNNMMRQPTSNKLLPDPIAAPYTQPKYTLVLEISDLLVHAEWTYQTGWRFKKRPGVDKFLELVTIPMFELVVFSADQYTMTSPLIDTLDPNGFIIYRLGRDSTQFSDGLYVKNLNCLNRDLSKVIVVDWSENSVKFHRNNAVIIPRWTGEDDDTTLVDLAIFLRTIAASDVDDVREVLSYYSQFDNPIETFREKQRKLLEHMEETEAKERKKESSLASKWANTFLKNLHRADMK